jgi:hypothetical protein
VQSVIGAISAHAGAGSVDLDQAPQMAARRDVVAAGEQTHSDQSAVSRGLI